MNLASALCIKLHNGNFLSIAIVVHYCYQCKYSVCVSLAYTLLSFSILYFAFILETIRCISANCIRLTRCGGRRAAKDMIELRNERIRITCGARDKRRRYESFGDASQSRVYILQQQYRRCATSLIHLFFIF